MDSRTIPPLGAALLSLLLLALFTPFVLAGEQANSRTAVLPLLSVAEKPVATGFHADAIVEAVQQATVAAQVAGRIVEVKVDAGQVVRKGQLLMRIDAREAAEAAQAARSQLQTAEAHYQRIKDLRQQSFVSQAGLDKARADYDAAKAAAVQAGVGFGHASVTAPITGVVALRHAEAGEMAAPGRPLLTIVNPAGLRVTASVPQYRLPQVRSVREAEVVFSELGKTVTASSVQLLPTADEATHTSSVRVGLPADITGVVPGMAARVYFITGQARKLTVPNKAVVRRGEMRAVYVLADSGLVLRQLRLGETFGNDEVEVLAGLVAGEQVVLDPVQAVIRLQAQKPASR